MSSVTETADIFGVGNPALRYTIRQLHLHPALPAWHRDPGRCEHDGQLQVLLRWRRTVSGRAGGTRKPEFYTGLLDAAQEHLEAVQAALDARWAEVTGSAWWDVAPCWVQELYAALAARSREAGPQVLLSHRAAADLIESMTGHQRSLFTITAAKKHLEARGCLATSKTRLTTIYDLLPLLANKALPPIHGSALFGAGQRPWLSSGDREVLALSVGMLQAKRWAPGRAVALAWEAAARCEEDRQRVAWLDSVAEELLAPPGRMNGYGDVPQAVPGAVRGAVRAVPGPN